VTKAAAQQATVSCIIGEISASQVGKFKNDCRDDGGSKHF
jgi:hypothetical protein